MRLNYIRRIIEDSPEPTIDYFLKTHRAIEGYSNRIVFIALRLHGLKYEQARKVINSRYLRVIGTLKNALIKIDKEKGKQLLSKSSINESISLYLTFTSRYRNMFMHNILSDQNYDQLLPLLLRINVNFLRELEYYVKEIFDHSAFDDPRKWGAKKSSRIFSEEEIDFLDLGSGVKAPLDLEEAKRRAEQIKWEHKNNQP